MRLGEFLFWTALWIAAVFIILYPNFLTYVAEIFGIGRGSDLAIYFALILLYYLVFRANVVIEDLKHEITKLVSKIAIYENEKYDHKAPTKKSAIKKNL